MNADGVAGLSLQSLGFTGFLHTRKTEILHLPQQIKKATMDITGPTLTRNRMPPTLSYTQSPSVLPRSPMMYAIPKSKLKGQPPPWVHLYDNYTLDVQRPWDLCSEDSDCVPYLSTGDW